MPSVRARNPAARRWTSRVQAVSKLRLGSSITSGFSTKALVAMNVPVDTARTFSGNCATTSHGFSTSLRIVLTAVISGLIPINHRTNNNDKFFTFNFLVIVVNRGIAT